MKTDSPSPDKQLGQITKFLALLNVSFDEIQVVIDHPQVRSEVAKALRRAMFPSRVRLYDALQLASEDTPLTMLYRAAMEYDFEPLLSVLSDRQRAVVELRYGYPDSRQLGVADVAKTMSITQLSVRRNEHRSLERMRQTAQALAI